MSVGTLFTLFVIPSLYMLIAKDHQRERVIAETPSDGTCLAPVTGDLRISKGCGLVADAKCRWSVSCDEKWEQTNSL